MLLPASPCSSSPRAAAEARTRPIPSTRTTRTSRSRGRTRGSRTRTTRSRSTTSASTAGPSGCRPFSCQPPGKGPYPAVIYLHGQGGDRLEMLYTASWLAGRRAVALTVESPYSPNREIELGPGVEGLRKERNRTVQSVVELRRAVDLLQSLPQVDDDKIGFVGYSAGARTGAILAGVEPQDQGVRAHVGRRGLGRRVHDARPAGAARRDPAAPRGHGRPEVHRAGEPVEALLPGGAEGLGRPEGRARDADQGGQRAEEGRLVRRRPRSRGPEGAARPARLARRGAGDRGPARRGSRDRTRRIARCTSGRRRSASTSRSPGG